MTGLHASRSMARAAFAAAVVAGLGISTSAIGQVLVTEHFNTDPGWVGVDNMLGNPDGLHPPGTQTSAIPGHGTNFGFSTTDTTGSTVLPPDFDGAGPFVPTASGAGEAGGGLANGRNPFPPNGKQSYYGDAIGPLNMNTPLLFSGVLTFTENRDRARIGFFNSFANDTTYGPAGTQPGPDQGSHRRPEFLGIEGDASSGIRLTIELGRPKGFTAGGFNQSTANTLRDSGTAFLAARNGVTSANIIPVPFIFSYDPNAGTARDPALGGGFNGQIKLTIPGATFNPVGTHVAQIQDGDSNGIDDKDADGNDAPEDAETFVLNLSESNRTTANSYVFDRFGMINGLRDQGAGDNGQDAFIDDVTYTVAIPEPTGLTLLALGGAGMLARRRRSA
jgi:hypothetical protein